MGLRHFRAFSLIELLVVIAVVGLLVAMVVPSLEAARESARFAICKSNLRQMGVAVFTYAADFRGSSPGEVTNPRPGWVETSWMMKLAPYLGANANQPEWLTSLPNARMKVYQCPTSWPRPISIQTRITYGMNFSMASDAGAYNPDPYKTNALINFYTDRLLSSRMERLWMISDCWGLTSSTKLQWDRSVMDQSAAPLLDYYERCHYVKGRGRLGGNGLLNFVMGDGHVFGTGKNQPDKFGSGTVGTRFVYVSYKNHGAQVFEETW